MSRLEQRLEQILKASPNMMRALEQARSLALADWMIFSGAVYQRVLNHLTRREPDYGLKDYDLGYFDPDTSWDAEDRAIRAAAAHFDPDLAPLVEVRNQARVHLWFEQRFGEPYDALASTSQALGRFVSPLFAVAVRLEADDRLVVHAPFGLEDLFALRLRPNPTRVTRGFAKAAASVAARWPEVRVEA